MLPFCLQLEPWSHHRSTGLTGIPCGRWWFRCDFHRAGLELRTIVQVGHELANWQIVAVCWEMQSRYLQICLRHASTCKLQPTNVSGTTRDATSYQTASPEISLINLPILVGFKFVHPWYPEKKRLLVELSWWKAPYPADPEVLPVRLVVNGIVGGIGGNSVLGKDPSCAIACQCAATVSCDGMTSQFCKIL